MDVFTILGYASDSQYSNLSDTDLLFALVPPPTPPAFRPIVVMFF